MHIAVKAMPNPQTRFVAIRPLSWLFVFTLLEFVLVRLQYKAEPPIGGASVANSLPGSSLFVVLLRPKAGLPGSQTLGVRLQKAAVFYENAVVEHKAQTHCEGLLSLSGLCCAF